MVVNKPEIVFIHSLNNYTGSPNVLSVVIRGFIGKGYHAKLITSRGDGFLSNIPALRYKYTCYKWSDSKIVTLFLLLLSQAALFFRVVFASNRPVYYINTIIPFGAILACRLTGKRFVIHVHENMRQHKPLYSLYRTIYSSCNRKSVFVSKYLMGTAVNCRQGQVIYNALPDDFRRTANGFLQNNNVSGETILMIASLRRFKGVYEFVELARRMPQYRFELVVNATEQEVEQFAVETGKPDNLNIYPSQTDVHPFYQRAKLLLQLSHPDEWVETFGLTILEAMTYGIPAIVPPVGGPVELVGDGENGFTVDPLQLDTIGERIGMLMTDPETYRRFSEKALAKSGKFSETEMINKIEEYIV